MTLTLALSITSLLAAFAVVAMKICFASKCDKINLCWGLVSVDREVEIENKLFRQGSDPELNLLPRQTQNLTGGGGG